MTALAVRGLSAGYEGSWVLHDVTFSVDSGEFLSILGCNGSGKSTLIKSILGLLTQTRGDIQIKGKPLKSLTPRTIAGLMAYVPQTFRHEFEFTVQEIITMGRYAHQGPLEGLSRNDKALIEESMELTKVSHLRAKNAGHLSGGERQRVFIARALAQDAPFLILDEPSSHLDINYQVDIYNLLKSLQEKRGKTILCSEHNINLVLPYSQRLILLKDGRIHGSGPPGELITQANIRDVFGAHVDIRSNPRTGLPEISLIAGGNL